MSHLTNHTFVRVFFALWPSEKECNQLIAWQKPLTQLCGGRVMRAETLHNTLVFIGNIESSQLAVIRSAAEAVNVERFVLNFDKVGNWDHNRIVYAAPGSVPLQLTQLVKSLQHHLEAQGCAFDKRPYQPHVTLLRNAHCRDSPLPVLQPVSWQADGFVLMQSVHSEGLVNYRTLARFPLSARSNSP